MLLPVSTAPDGSPVELYERLPELGEGDVVASVLPAGASLLELGCGTGRITRQLVRLDYRVTAVDESAEMLALVRGAETVQARIETLELGRRFDAVLGLVHGEMEYEAEGMHWRHSFAMRVFADDAELEAALAEAGLRLERRLDARWFVAVAGD